MVGTLRLLALARRGPWQGPQFRKLPLLSARSPACPSVTGSLPRASHPQRPPRSPALWPALRSPVFPRRRDVRLHVQYTPGPACPSVRPPPGAGIVGAGSLPVSAPSRGLTPHPAGSDLSVRSWRPRSPRPPWAQRGDLELEKPLLLPCLAPRTPGDQATATMRGPCPPLGVPCSGQEDHPDERAPWNSHVETM